jgi:hypothetical protein
MTMFGLGCLIGGGSIPLQKRRLGLRQALAWVKISMDQITVKYLIIRQNKEGIGK